MFDYLGLATLDALLLFEILYLPPSSETVSHQILIGSTVLETNKLLQVLYQWRIENPTLWSLGVEMMHCSFDGSSIIYPTMPRRLVIVWKIDFLKAQNMCFDYFFTLEM